MEVNIHHAKTHLSKLISAAESGEEVIIARNGAPAVKLVPVHAATKRPRKQMWGAGIGKIWIASDFDSKGTNDEIADLFETRRTSSESSGRRSRLRLGASARPQSLEESAQHPVLRGA